MERTDREFLNRKSDYLRHGALRTIRGGIWIVFVFGLDSPTAPLLLGYQKNVDTAFDFAELKSRLKMPHLFVFSVVIIAICLSTLSLPSLTTDFHNFILKWHSFL